MSDFVWDLCMEVALLKAARAAKRRGGPECACGGCEGKHHIRARLNGAVVKTGVVHHLGRHHFEKLDRLDADEPDGTDGTDGTDDAGATATRDGQGSHAMTVRGKPPPTPSQPWPRVHRVSTLFLAHAGRRAAGALFALRREQLRHDVGQDAQAHDPAAL